MGNVIEEFFVFGGINDAFLMEAYDGVLDSENLIDRIQADIREYYEYLNNTYRKADIYIVIPYELLLANMYGEVHPNGYGYQMLGEFIAAEALRLKIGSENGMEGYEQSHED